MVKSLTILFIVSAFMLFSIQFPLSKEILPYLGGSSSVWTTTVFFFQTLLFIGYLYTGFITKRLSFKKQFLVHSTLVLISVLFLFSANSINSDGLDYPITWIIKTLFIYIGVPFFVVSTTSPLFQRWFSYTKFKEGGDPYFLYSASNIGSFLALISYPFIIETTLKNSSQIFIWRLLYLLFAIGVVFVGKVLLSNMQEQKKVDDNFCKTPSLTRQFKWVILAFIPSGLFLGTTTYINMDISSVPIIWILPLGIYLLSFILAFSTAKIKPIMVKRYSAVLMWSLILFVSLHGVLFMGWFIPSANALLMLFCFCFILHSCLYDDRPDTEYLNRFYILISFGGLLGSFFNSILAPIIFLDSIIEFTLLIILGLSIMIYYKLIDLSKSFRFLFPSIILASIIIFRVSGFIQDALPGIYKAERSFYGNIRVTQYGDEINLEVGNTRQGIQRIYKDGERSLSWSSYTPLNNVVNLFKDNISDWSIAVVGLGAGSAACSFRDSDDVVLFEIDKKISDIAKDKNWFTYINECKPDMNIEIIDGRMGLQKQATEQFDFIMLDAFLSGNVPSHLITKEAISMYFDKLKPDGIIALNISNAFLDLEPVIANISKDIGAMVLKGSYYGESDGYGSSWLFVTKDREKYSTIQDNLGLRDARRNKRVGIWTDNFYNIFETIRF